MTMLAKQLAPLDRPQRRLRSAYQLPLIQGGQGRTGSDIRDESQAFWFMIFTGAAFVLMCVGIGLAMGHFFVATRPAG